MKKNLQQEISFSLNHEHLRLLPDDDGNAADVTNSRSVDRAASFILDVLRQYTENPDVKVTFSIAGGRKSMSAVSALCMSLLGRRGDRLCHILVDAPFDDPALIPKFYFPVAGQEHVDREGKVFSSTAANLELSCIPFVHCRYLIENELKRLPGDYSRMVALANSNAEQFETPSALELDPAELTVRIGAREFQLQLQKFLLYWMLAERKSNGQDYLYHRKDLCEEFERFLKQAQKKLPQKFFYKCIALSEDGKIQEDTLNKRVSDLAAVLKKYEVPEIFLPSRGKGIYGLGLEPAKIHIRTSAGCPKSCNCNKLEV